LRAAGLALCALAAYPGSAQELIPLGPGEPAGSRSSVLPPPSGSQNPVLPPPSGYRYPPGTQGRWGDTSASAPARAAPLPRAATQDLAAVVRPGAAGEPRREVSAVSGIGPAVARCWHPPNGAETAGAARFTLRFSLRRNGTVIATPRITSRAGTPDAATEDRLIESGLAALRECAPLPLSPGLGAGIAGRPISLRFEMRS
jgi:hypothetical protein